MPANFRGSFFAAQPVLKNGLSNEARLGAQSIGEPPGQINFRETWRFVSARRGGRVPTLGNLLGSSALRQ